MIDKRYVNVDDEDEDDLETEPEVDTEPETETEPEINGEEVFDLDTVVAMLDRVASDIPFYEPIQVGPWTFQRVPDDRPAFPTIEYMNQVLDELGYPEQDIDEILGMFGLGAKGKG